MLGRLGVMNEWMDGQDHLLCEGADGLMKAPFPNKILD